MNQPPTQTSPLEIMASPELAGWLTKQNLSLAVTTYQTNRLFFISSQANGRLKFHERLFDKPMGLYAAGDRLYMSTRYQLWHLENLLKAGEQYGECDRLYSPRTAYTTGDVNVHDVALDDSQNIIFVNTDFSCLATLSKDYSFVPLWQPPFISKLVAEDRCHLNGLAMREGKPAYTTACSTTDTAAGWRNCRSDGGVVIDVQNNEIIATGLSMPHSPRWYKGKLWLLNSGTGELGYLDGSNFVPIAFCPGFVRGLAFWGDFAVVGLSKLRSPNFTGLILEKRLKAEGNTPHCGLMVIDLNNGQIVHWLHIGQTIEELFDIVVLPGVCQAQALGLQGDDVQRLVTFPNSGGIVTTKPTVERPSIGQVPPVAGLPQESRRQLQVKYQRVYHLNTSNALTYDRLTYPSLQQRWGTQPPKGELLGISAAVEGSLVGFAIAERISEETAEIISLLVLPECRRQGIGTKLLIHLEQELKQQGCQKLSLTYQTTALTEVALEPILKKLGWGANSTNGGLRQAFKKIAGTGEEKSSVQYRPLQNLTVEQSISYNDLTFPKIQTRWSRKQPRGYLVGMLAEVAGEKVGLVLAEVFSLQPQTALEAEVISLFVLPSHRQQGIGTGLIENLEIGLRSLGCQQLKLLYKSTSTTTLALEPLLLRQNWQPPQVNFLLGKTTTQKVSQAPWLGKYPLPNKFTIFPWSELTDADEKQVETLDYPTPLSPFSNTPAEPINSLGLRYDSQLVGWMVTHRVASDAIRYSTMFVDKRFQRLGRGISLLSESILRQVDSSVPYCVFAVAQDNPAMLQFVDKHLEPYLTEVTHSYVALKQLSS
ncbi:TIGR03032 family protein [Limnoraphis robusta]|uniref:TIGR03032 family protein n=1 Tax=Limnoraphis robusta TaxID=1118279 RepID=UPI0009E598BF|nr:TIGR03032 family protein [Limnoraphis robusta]